MFLENSQVTANNLLKLLNEPPMGNDVANTSLVSLFQEQVTKNPEAIALIFEEQTLTYQSLDEYSNQVAFYLRQQGVCQEMLVPIYIDRSIEMIIGILAILKAGGAYVPIDPAYPLTRIDFILKDTEATLVLTQHALENRFENIQSPPVLISIDTLLKENTTLPKANINIPIDSTNLAYVIYTSGTTGTPKGVLVTHKNVTRLFFNNSPIFNFSRNDIWTMFHSFCFDFSVWEMYGALLHGGRLVIVTDACRKSPEAFSELVINQKVTILNQTPAVFYRLQEYLLENKATMNLRYVIFGGAALQPIMLKSWKKRYPLCHLINMYGITETTVHATYKEVEFEMIYSNESNIGRLLCGLDYLILDNQQKQIPKGQTGELYIKGDGLARGYLKRPELTAERFITLDIKGQEGQRFYKSGDLVYLNSTNDLIYVGRIDDQVKIRGHRIELGAIETILNQKSEVRQQVVLARTNQEGMKELVAYIVCDDKLTFESLRLFLVDRLPDYMIPAFIVKLDAMPLTENGKIDKTKIPEPNIDLLIADREKKPPTNDLENRVLKIWSQVLGLDAKKISIEDKFFEIGGNSLKLIKVKKLLESEANIMIDSLLLFQYPTIKSLVAFFQKEATTSRTLNHELDNAVDLFEDNLTLFRNQL